MFSVWGLDGNNRRSGRRTVNRWAESLIVEYTSVVLKRPVPALLEHRQFGLPDRDRVGKIFANTPHSWISFMQGSTDVWLLMMLTYQTLLTAGTDFVNELNRRFNQVYAPRDWSEPCHRAGYLLSKTRRDTDLESMRASFAHSQECADLQSVLSFCQLFLTIAQNARVTADKDRHIGNIEGALAEAAARLGARDKGTVEQRLERMLARVEALGGQLEGRMQDFTVSVRALEQSALESRVGIWKKLASVRRFLRRISRSRTDSR